MALLLRLHELHADGDLAVARGILVEAEPRDERQAAERDRIVAWIDAHPGTAHLRSNLAGHLTASAIVVDHAGERVLLTHHRKLGRWLQLGGHCDGEANLVRAALLECSEESGIQDLAIDPRPLDVDIHRIPARPGEPEHDHLDTRFVVHAPRGAIEVASEESLALRWFRLEELEALDTDDSVRRLARAWLARGR
jgi:8-oxo-dGTP pyrophosphatase MutT (NUDIX family)